LGIPYTHSGVRASAIAMDKQVSKAMFSAAGLPVPKGEVIPVEDLLTADPMPLPYVIKPVSEGSSVGVEIIRQGDNRRAAVAQAWRFGRSAMVEEFIPGRELTVSVMGDRALAVTDIIADAGTFYDYESKYADGGSHHIIPAEVHPSIYARAMDVALRAHKVIGCRGATRCDFRYDDTKGEPGRLVLLEINTQPGLTPTSLLPEQAAYLGIDFPQLCAWMWNTRHAGRQPDYGGPPSFGHRSPADLETVPAPAALDGASVRLAVRGSGRCRRRRCFVAQCTAGQQHCLGAGEGWRAYGQCRHAYYRHRH
jgi:D-alanine-D-alanine ligase